MTGPAEVSAYLRRSLITALSLAVVAVAAVAALRAAFAPRLEGAHYEHTIRNLIGCSVGLVAAAVHVALYRRTPRPAAFLLRRKPVFVAPAKPTDYAGLPLFAGVLASMVVPGHWLVAVLSIAAALAFIRWLTRYRHPIVVLSPDHLSVRWSDRVVQGRVRSIPWNALGPLDTSDTGTFWLTTPGEGTRIRLEARRVGIDPAFLAHAIRYYTDNPRARADIGTADGHADLVSSHHAG